ncbi:hypothetical protein H0E87_007628, partial [Populus deltoides]
GGPCRDVMIDVAGSPSDPDEGLGLGDILKPDLIMPLIETLLLEEGLTSHLPEVLRTGQVDLSEFGINPTKCEWFVVPEPVA